ncbi:hypothetical protein FQN60_001052 [Etheostoma spectabile]|uniref:Uncharacterized protein n=1 Tax=Etheostoma spectabile TaxID=54343 RepID=A0A5J5CDD7_9PERO|nr:hypothetical protein FQN60_001052 [Etheostoma spectabile]
MDYCTRWAQAYAIKSKSAAEVTRALTKLVEDNPNTWDQYLDAVMFGLRTKKQLTTQFPPNYFMFGKEARYPSEVPEHYQFDGSFEDDYTNKEVAIDIERHEKIVNIVNENVEKLHARMRGKDFKKGTAKPSDGGFEPPHWLQNPSSSMSLSGYRPLTGSRTPSSNMSLSGYRPLNAPEPPQATGPSLATGPSPASEPPQAACPFWLQAPHQLQNPLKQQSLSGYRPLTGSRTPLSSRSLSGY